MEGYLMLMGEEGEEGEEEEVCIGVGGRRGG